MGMGINRKILIVTYYWPPAGGPGVQRILKFTKYLPHYGWQPLILTVKGGEFPALDESLCSDIPTECRVARTSLLEPNTLYKKFIGMKYDQLLASRLAIARIDYRYQHQKDIFFKLICNVAFQIANDLPQQTIKYHAMRGIGLGVKFLSPIGPIELLYGFGDKRLVDPRAGQHVFYFEMGYKF